MHSEIRRQYISSVSNLHALAVLECQQYWDFTISLWVFLRRHYFTKWISLHYNLRSCFPHKLRIVRCGGSEYPLVSIWSYGISATFKCRCSSFCEKIKVYIPLITSPQKKLYVRSINNPVDIIGELYHANYSWVFSLNEL